MASSVAAVSSNTSPQNISSDLAPPSKKRKTSNASCTSGASFGSETGRLLQSLPSVGSSLDDVGTGIATTTGASAAPEKSKEVTEAAVATATEPSPKPHAEGLASETTANASEKDTAYDTANASEKAPGNSYNLTSTATSSSITSSNKAFKPRSSSLATTSTRGSSKGSGARFLPDRRLQPKKRKMSYESYDASLCDSALGLASLASVGDDSSGMILPAHHIRAAAPATTTETSNKSVTSSDTAGRNHHHNLPDVSALEHLDALGAPAQLPAAPPVPAVTAVTSAPLTVAAPPPAPGTVLDHPQQKQSGATDQQQKSKSVTAGSEQPVAEATAASAHAESEEDGSNATLNSSGQRLLLEALVMSGGLAGSSHSGQQQPHHHLHSGGRNRFESWGGMSDLSIPLGGEDPDTAAAIATASALHKTGLLEDLTAAAGLTGSCGNSVVSSVTEDLYRGAGWHHSATASPGGRPPQLPPTAVRVRERSDTLGSLADLSLGGIDGAEFAGDLQKYVAATVANVGDQLAELTGPAETIAAAESHHQMEAPAPGVKQHRRNRLESDASSSIATPLIIGAQLDDSASAKITVSGQNSADQHQAAADTMASVAKEVAANAAGISIDHDAVAAAVNAAQSLDLSAISHLSIPDTLASGGGSQSSDPKKGSKKRKLPLNKSKNSASRGMEPPKSTLTPQALEEIRERARKAAGYVPPSSSGQVHPSVTPAKRPLPPIKKRAKRTTADSSAPLPSGQVSSMPVNTNHVTPKVSNSRRRVPDMVTSTAVPSVVTSSAQSISAPAAKPPASVAKEAKGQSSQKWDNMYNCLLEFIEERREEENQGSSETEKVEWVWDGNVPTTHKTKDGKALGRWINNQRSAKSKGTLKPEREQRLVNAGLKWSVLASNSWNEMLEELRIYIREYTKDGRAWDGNVPTNYKIKPKAASRIADEDKNLGRWVNRQRSLFQAGKLRKDRQEALEKVGLKWSMLATTSWESMYDTLVVYVEEKTKGGLAWDGNVPANYRTDDSPPRALGRWINRQRSAYVKKKLKAECVDKLNTLGLKWSVHERKANDDIMRHTEICSSANPSGGNAFGKIDLSSAVPDQVGSTTTSTVIVAMQPKVSGQPNESVQAAPTPAQPATVSQNVVASPSGGGAYAGENVEDSGQSDKPTDASATAGETQETPSDSTGADAGQPPTEQSAML